LISHAPREMKQVVPPFFLEGRVHSKAGSIA
jgi:hypothetical protein